MSVVNRLWSQQTKLPVFLGCLLNLLFITLYVKTLVLMGMLSRCLLMTDKAKISTGMYTIKKEKKDATLTLKITNH